MGHLVFVILQMRMLRIQFSISVLILAVLVIRGVYWKSRGRNPYVYGFLWMLPLLGLFTGKCQLFEQGIWEEWETFFWTIFDEMSVLGMMYWVMAGAICLGYVISKRRLIRRGKKYPVYMSMEAGGKKCPVRVSDCRHSPYTIGVIHPYIVLPEDFKSRFTTDELEMVLRHETTHIRCWHSLFFCIASLWKCVFWLNPIVHYGVKVFQTDMEIFCDSVAAEKGSRVEYGKLILSEVTGAPLSENILQKVNFFFSMSECRTRTKVLAAYREKFATYRRIIFRVTGIVLLLSVAAVLAGSRFVVTGGNGIETVFSIEDEETKCRTELALTDEEYEQILVEDREDELIIDTKALREKLQRSGYPAGAAGMWYDSYRFGPGFSGVWRIEVTCNLYDSSKRFISVKKALTGWRRAIRFL
ncbi:MAG: M56 family metallopeptidase [Eubacterium sp.]|jgi:beta-lactamase regulating signal transducer with metallopeptidase domain|nr:M56 family metallopeptidase [Eubacterium sp.]